MWGIGRLLLVSLSVIYDFHRTPSVTLLCHQPGNKHTNSGPYQGPYLWLCCRLKPFLRITAGLKTIECVFLALVVWTSGLLWRKFPLSSNAGGCALSWSVLKLSLTSHLAVWVLSRLVTEFYLQWSGLLFLGSKSTRASLDGQKQKIGKGAPRGYSGTILITKSGQRSEGPAIQISFRCTKYKYVTPTHKAGLLGFSFSFPHTHTSPHPIACNRQLEALFAQCRPLMNASEAPLYFSFFCYIGYVHKLSWHSPESVYAAR